MGRISRQVMYLEMARVASRRSTCHRLNVGSIITLDNSPVSVGWNGQTAGAPHCLGNHCPGIVPGQCGTLHAEHNALTKAAQVLNEGSVVDLYVTHSPCTECVLLIQNHQLYVRRIFFEVPYRSVDHLTTFRSAYNDPDIPGEIRKTEIFEVTPAGYVIDYFTRRVVEFP